MRRQRKKLAQVARLQALGQLTIPQQGNNDAPQGEFDEALAAFGFARPADEGEGDAPPVAKCYLWPCNVPTFGLWQAIQTQWRVGGMGSRTGLDYASMAVYMREVLRIKPNRRWGRIWSELQAMEVAALNAYAEKQE